MENFLVAVVPIRKGSVRVKNKNFKNFAGGKSINTQDKNFKKNKIFRRYNY